MLCIRTEPRGEMRPINWLIMIASCLAGVLGVLVIVFIAVKASPTKALWIMFSMPLSSAYHFSETLVKTTPIIFTGLAVGLALKMKLWNIGAEGQMHMGALGAVWAAQTFSHLPAIALIPLMMLSAMLCGAFISGIVGLLKRWLNVNEILTSLLLNYVATSLLNYFIYGPWRDPRNPGFPLTPTFAPAAWLPVLKGTRLHLWFLLALLLAFILWVLIERSKWGYEIRATGESQGAARYAGIPVERNIVVVFVLCGAIAALGGMGEIAGLHHKLQPGNVSSNYGSLGIIVAWLAGANPLGIILAALLAGVLLKGSEALQISMGVPSDIVQITIGLLLASILICKFFKDNKLVIERKAEVEV